MIDVCDSCLRRSLLIAHLAPGIAGLLGRPRRRVGSLLALPERELLLAAAGRGVRTALAFLDELDPEAERGRLEAGEGMALCMHAARYPQLLAELEDRPVVLYLAGREDALDALGREPAVAIVGTRRPSDYAREVARALGRGLGACGIPVVSGLALGVDGTAHRGCLEGGGLPIAVLACGPDVVYPRRHRGLFDQVRAAGLVLSELPPGTRPFRWSFPARNRIMAGLARMTVVVEAGEPSGSLITSDFARDLGRCVAAVPGRVTSRVARGSNRLLQDGALTVMGTEDILDELYGVGRRPPGCRTPPAQIGLAARSQPVSAELRRVLEAAERHDSVEAIAAAARLSPARARAALGRLEADGHLVRRRLGGWEPSAW